MSRVARSIGLVVGIAVFTVVGYVNAALEWLARIIVTVSTLQVKATFFCQPN